MLCYVVSYLFRSYGKPGYCRQHDVMLTYLLAMMYVMLININNNNIR